MAPRKSAQPPTTTAVSTRVAPLPVARRPVVVNADLRMADPDRPQVTTQQVQLRKLLPSDAAERGLPGTKIWAGLVFEDPNQELQGQKGLRKLQQMAYDPTVASVIAVHDRPIRAAAWRVDPADDSEAQLAIADEVWWNLNEFGTQSFDDVIREAHTRFWAGFNYSEICYDIVSGGQYDGHIAWNKIAWRHPLAKWRWDVEELDTEGGAKIRQLVAVTQLAPPAYTYITIPRDKLLIWTQDLLGENFDGVPLIRFAFKPWFYKDYLLKIQAIGLQRAYMGIPVGTYPTNFTPNEVAATQAVVENIRSSENAGAVKPAHIELEIVKIPLEGATMQEAINFHDRQILLSTLTQFLALGSQGAAGAYSLSEDQSELFLMQLNAQANYDAEIINLDPGIPRLVAYNYGQQEKYPQLVHGPIGQRDFEKLASGLARLAQQGILTPDDSLEDAIRDQMGLPERDNAITDDMLTSLIAGVGGNYYEMQARKGDLRYPIPSTAMSPKPEIIGGPPSEVQQMLQGIRNQPAPGTVPSAPGVPPHPTMIGLPSSGTPAGLRFAEALARRPWRRVPRGPITEEIRRRVKATEDFADALENYAHKIGKPMEKPSIYAAKHRKPYQVVRRQIQAAETSGADRAEAKRRRVTGTVVMRHQVVADRHVPEVRAILAKIKPKVDPTPVG